MLNNSALKLAEAINRASTLHGKFQKTSPHKELKSSLILIIAGSLARFEAELSEGDIDSDAVFKCSNKRDYGIYKDHLQKKIFEPMRLALEKAKGKLGMETRLDLSGAFFMTYKRLRGVTTESDFGQFATLLLSSRAITNEAKLQELLGKVVRGHGKSQLKRKLAKTLGVLLEKDKRTLEGGSRDPVEDKHCRYHLITYSLQALAIGLARDIETGINVARLNNWSICESLKNDIHGKGLWAKLRRGVVSSLFVRDPSSSQGYVMETHASNIMIAVKTARMLASERGLHL